MPNAALYECVIEHLCERGRNDEAVAQLLKMKDHGLKPEFAHYTPVIIAEGLHGDVTGAACGARAHCAPAAAAAHATRAMPPPPLPHPPCWRSCRGAAGRDAGGEQPGAGDVLCLQRAVRRAAASRRAARCGRARVPTDQGVHDQRWRGAGQEELQPAAGNTPAGRQPAGAPTAAAACAEAPACTLSTQLNASAVAPQKALMAFRALRLRSGGVLKFVPDDVLATLLWATRHARAPVPAAASLPAHR